jgi:hypothetical protein
MRSRQAFDGRLDTGLQLRQFASLRGTGTAGTLSDNAARHSRRDGGRNGTRPPSTSVPRSTLTSVGVPPTGRLQARASSDGEVRASPRLSLLPVLITRGIHRSASGREFLWLWRSQRDCGWAD